MAKEQYSKECKANAVARPTVSSGTWGKLRAITQGRPLTSSE